jgi:hypothetical protein
VADFEIAGGCSSTSSTFERLRASRSEAKPKAGPWKGKWRTLCSHSKKAGRRNRQGNVVAFGSWENGVGTGGCGGKESTGEMGERDGVEEKV